MRVLMIHKTKKGGVAIHVKNVKRELEKKGIEVVEITRNETLRISSFIKSYHKLKHLYTKWSKEYDIIHAHDWSIAYPAVRANIPNLVVTLHGFATNPIGDIFEKIIIKKLKWKVIVVSPAMLKKFPDATYLPNGIDLKNFKKKENISRKRKKAGIAQKYCALQIMRILKKLNLGFTYVKNIPYEKIPEFYSQIEIFISLPPKTTGFNMVWLEAMACEVPYIIGTNYGIGEILPIYKVNSFMELEILLMKIKNNELPPLKGCRKWIIKNKFTWKEHVKRLLKIYEEIKRMY